MEAASKRPASRDNAKTAALAKKPKLTPPADFAASNGSTKPKLSSNGLNNGKSSVPKTEQKPTTSTGEADGGEHIMLVDKYKPQNYKQIIGQQHDNSNVHKLIKWLKEWHQNFGPEADKDDKPKAKPAYKNWGTQQDGSSFKAALLSGPPGIGKTTTATLVCQELGFEYKEFNASDVRSKKALSEEVATLLSNKVVTNFFNTKSKSQGLDSKHVLIMDEVDGMAGNEDRGGMAELIQLIKKSKVPVICICNDRQSTKIRSLTNYCFDLRFVKPPPNQIKAAMMSMCFKEKIQIDAKALEEIIVSTNQDIRQVLHYISVLAASKDKIQQKISSAAIKDVRLGPFDAIKKVFPGPSEANRSFNERADLFFADYGLMPLMVYENYSKTHPLIGTKQSDTERLERMAHSADSMAFADVIEKNIRSQMNWSLLGLQAAFSTVLPSYCMRSSLNVMPMFPTILGRMSNCNKRDRLLQELGSHMSLKISGSKLALNCDYLEPLSEAVLRPLLKEDVEGAAEVMNEYYLRKDDIEAIMELIGYRGSKDPMANVKSTVKAALTRSLNKDGERLPYAMANDIVKKEKRGKGKKGDAEKGSKAEKKPKGKAAAATVKDEDPEPDEPMDSDDQEDADYVE